MGGRTRRLAKVRVYGIAIFLLGGLTSGWAQQRAVVPAVQPLVGTKATSTTEAPPAAQNAPTDDYTVSPEDQLDINVMGVEEVSRTYRVSSNGLLTLPLLREPIPVAGESLDQLSHLIADKYQEAGILNNAQVTVTLRETRLHAVLVSGAVKLPQSYPVYGPTRLLDVIIKAGGLSDAAGNDAIIMRGDIGARADLAESGRAGGVDPSGNGQSFTLNIRKLVETGDDKTNILLYPGDRITVQRADLIYVMGAVARPGGYVLNESRQQVTVLKALAMAGDVTGIAKKGRITILRRDPTGPEDKREEIPVNYKEIVKGESVDLRLKPDDILFVPESAGIKAWRTTVSSAVTVATEGGAALMIYH